MNNSCNRVYFKCFPWSELITHSISDVLLDVIPSEWKTSKGKFWVVSHSIVDGSSDDDYFGLHGSWFSLFVCSDRDTARKLKVILKKKAISDSQGHEQWAFGIHEECLDWPRIANQLARCQSDEVYIYATAQEADPDGKNWDWTNRDHGYISLKA